MADPAPRLLTFSLSLELHVQMEAVAQGPRTAVHPPLSPSCCPRTAVTPNTVPHPSAAPSVPAEQEKLLEPSSGEFEKFFPPFLKALVIVERLGFTAKFAGTISECGTAGGAA